jgi:hypothetical protein
LHSHLLLEFDPERVTVAGKRYNPPNPRGISGGAAFRARGGVLKLAGIMTEHRRRSRVLVAIRTAEVASIARHVADALAT